MIRSRRASFARLAGIRLRTIVLAAAVLLAAGSLRADTITLKTADGSAAVDGTIASLDAAEVVYTTAGSDRQSREPVETVLQIEAPGEPELTSAEQAYADGKWAEAVAKYQRTLKFSLSDWARYRANVRLIDAAANNKEFAAEVAAFVELARRDPANAPKRCPEIKGVKKGELTVAVKDVRDVLPDASLETKLVLLSFLADMHAANDEPALAADARDEITKLQASAVRPEAAKPVVTPSAARQKGALFDNGGDARRIVFICDASGSMLNKMATLKSELAHTIDGLKSTQSFNIIFLQDQQCAALARTQLVAGSSANKSAAHKFVDDAVTTGTTDPMPGLTLAFAQHPQLIYFLTDGDFPDNKAVTVTIAKLNRDHRARINTVAFVNDQDTDTDFLTLLKQIAAENGGAYKHVTEK